MVEVASNLGVHPSATFIFFFFCRRLGVCAPRNINIVFVAVVVLMIVVMELPTASSLNLTCYTCVTHNHNEDCYRNVSAANFERCKDDVPSMTCSVYREDRFGEFQFIVRGCNSSCVQTCGAWGESVDIDKCSSCCTTDLCNVDDAAATPWTATTTLLASCALASLAVSGWWL